MVLYQSKTIKVVSPRVFGGLFTICTPEIFARTILVIMISIHTRESMTLATKIIKFDQLRLKLWSFFKLKCMVLA